MSHIVAPAALSTTALVANQASILLTLKEPLAKPYCVSADNQPSFSLTYSVSNSKLIGTTAFVDIQAKLTIISPTKCKPATVQVFTETFTVAFQGQSAVPTSVTVTSLGRDSRPSDVSCCIANSFTVNDSLTVLIS